MKKILVLLMWITFLPVAAARGEDVDHFINAEMQRLKIPGLALAVVRDGALVQAKGYGLASVELEAPVKPETIFQSGSVGKQFTSAGVMLLVEEGKLKLDDPITKYLPNSPNIWHNITIRHLLTHTSGIPDYTDKEIDFRKDYTEEDLLKVLQKLPLDFSPGEKWSYSNSGYMLLGFIIHKVSGKFYGDFLDEKIFRPLNMNTTRIINEADIIPNRAAGYELKDDALKNQEWVAPSINTTADGSLYLTVLDMAKWEHALYNGQILKKTSWQQVWTQVALNSGKTHPYGFGWYVDQKDGHSVIQHSGHWQGFSTAISRYPDFGLTIIVMVNLADVETLKLTGAVAGILQPELKEGEKRD